MANNGKDQHMRIATFMRYVELTTLRWSSAIILTSWGRQKNPFDIKTAACLRVRHSVVLVCFSSWKEHINRVIASVSLSKKVKPKKKYKQLSWLQAPSHPQKKAQKIWSSTKPDREKKRERRMVSNEMAMPMKMSATFPFSERNIWDDNKAADKRKNPRSCSYQNNKHYTTICYISSAPVLL